MKARTQTFELLVDGTPYVVKATPYSFNDETRFRVSYNESPVHIFLWDSSVGRLTVIGDQAATMPDNLEVAIARKLQSEMSERRVA